MEPITITFYAQRHGDRAGDELTPAGRYQVQQMKQTFGSVWFDAVYASPKQRAIQTAAIVAGNDSAVRVSHGLYPPLTDDQIDRLWGDPAVAGGTIGDWYVGLQRGWGPRAQSLLLAAMREMAADVLQQQPDKTDINVCFTSHSLYLEMLLPERYQQVAPLAVAEMCIVRCELSGDLRVVDVQFVRRA